MNLSQNPFERMFLRWSASSGAQALLIAGMLTGMIGVLGVLLREGASVVSTGLMAVAAGSGAIALGLGGAAWVAAIGDDLDASRRRVRLGARWLLGSVAALLVAGILR